jgi:hypothetical protein
MNIMLKKKYFLLLNLLFLGLIQTCFGVIRFSNQAAQDVLCHRLIDDGIDSLTLPQPVRNQESFVEIRPCEQVFLSCEFSSKSQPSFRINFADLHDDVDYSIYIHFENPKAFRGLQGDISNLLHDQGFNKEAFDAFFSHDGVRAILTLIGNDGHEISMVREISTSRKRKHSSMQNGSEFRRPEVNNVFSELKNDNFELYDSLRLLDVGVNNNFNPVIREGHSKIMLFSNPNLLPVGDRGAGRFEGLVRVTDLPAEHFIRQVLNFVGLMQRHYKDNNIYHDIDPNIILQNLDKAFVEVDDYRDCFGLEIENYNENPIEYFGRNICLIIPGQWINYDGDRATVERCECSLPGIGYKGKNGVFELAINFGKVGRNFCVVPTIIHLFFKTCNKRGRFDSCLHGVNFHFQEVPRYVAASSVDDDYLDL